MEREIPTIATPPYCRFRATKEGKETTPRETRALRERKRVDNYKKNGLPSGLVTKQDRLLPTPQLITSYAEIRRVERPIDLIVIHCSATRCDSVYTPEMLIRDHLDRGFIHAGYHYYITRNGDLYALRPLSMIGAHIRGHNAGSIGICYEGGLDPSGDPKDTRTGAQRAMLSQLLLRLRELWREAKIVGHRDLSPDLNRDGIVTPDEWLKACPSFDVRREYGV